MSQHEVFPFLYMLSPNTEYRLNKISLLQLCSLHSKLNILINAHLRLVWLSSLPVMLYSTHPNTILNLLQKQVSHQSNSTPVGDTPTVTWHQPLHTISGYFCILDVEIFSKSKVVPKKSFARRGIKREGL